MGFFLKKLVSGLLMPLPGLLLVMAAGAVVWMRWKRRRLGAGLVVAGAVALVTLSLTPVADAVVRAVETDAPPFPGDSVAFVVVLGGGHTSDPGVPLSGQVGSAALHRLVEGITIATAQPWSRLVLSGWSGRDPRSNAEVYQALSTSLGFPRERTTLEPNPRDTRQEAEMLEPLLRGQRFALVTSASHMDRALALFRARGLEPIPAPTGHRAKEGQAFDALILLPSSANLERVRVAWHEVLGLAWARLTGGV